MEEERIDLALKVFKADERAKQLGNKGGKRFGFIIKELGSTANYDERKIQKLIALAKKHLKPSPAG